MNGAVGPVWLDPAAQAGALAALLSRLGLATEVVGDPGGAVPLCVAVSGLAVGGTAYGYAHAAQDRNGMWRWWLALPGGPALEAGAPLCEVSLTADAVCRALARAASPKGQPSAAAAA